MHGHLIERRAPAMVLLTMVGIASVLAACAAVARPPVAARAVTVGDALVQFSLVAALAAGDYSDGVPLKELLADGDFGVGTFRRLDGEMIVLEGKIYQALADGSIRAAEERDSTPFAAVKFFSEDGRVEHFAAVSLDELDAQLDRRLPHRNAPFAIRIDGELSAVTLRSVPAQTPPFRPLVDVVKHQVTWRHEGVRGTLVGLRSPAWVGTLNVAGYHWHFISDDRKIGGHVLACAFEDALLRYDHCESLVIRLPQGKAFDEFDTGEVDQQDIDKIERQRARASRK